MNAYEIAETLREEKESRERERYRRVQRLESLSPEYEQLTAERNALLAEATLLSLKGEKESAEEKKEQARALDLREREILAENNLPPDYLEVHYQCKKCEDKGFLDDGSMCECLKRRIKEAKFLDYDLNERTKEDNFSNYDLSIFSEEVAKNTEFAPRELAKIYLEDAKKYCADYGPQSNSLFFYGEPGTGKTYLISCIVNELLKKDVDLIYISAPNVIQLLYDDLHEKRHSTNSNRSTFKEVDLLIVDDLGTEVNSDFSQSVISEIIDERLLNNKRTIISTNYTPETIKTRYPKRMVSRITGNYKMLVFVGKDLRLKK